MHEDNFIHNRSQIFAPRYNKDHVEFHFLSVLFLTGVIQDNSNEFLRFIIHKVLILIDKHIFHKSQTIFG